MSCRLRLLLPLMSRSTLQGVQNGRRARVCPLSLVGSGSTPFPTYIKNQTEL